MRNIRTSMKKDIEYQILLIPAIVLFSIFVIYPSASTFVYSFTNWSDMNTGNIKFIGLENFARIFSDEMIMTGIKNSFIYAILATVLQSVMAVPLAVCLDMNLKTKNILRAVYYFPAVLSTLIVGYLWNYMLSTSDFGLVNRILANIGIERINFLGDKEYALYCVIGVSVWQWTGWNMTIYLANLQSISKELYESANIDGATGLKSFRYITLPMLYPATSFCFITGMINGLKVFDTIYAMTNGGPGYATESIISVMIKKGFTEGFYGYSCAIGIGFLGIVLVITMIQFKFLNKWGENIL